MFKTLQEDAGWTIGRRDRAIQTRTGSFSSYRRKRRWWKVGKDVDLRQGRNKINTKMSACFIGMGKVTEIGRNDSFTANKSIHPRGWELKRATGNKLQIGTELVLGPGLAKDGEIGARVTGKMAALHDMSVEV